MNEFFKGFVKTKDKKCTETFKDRTDLKQYDDVKDLPEYAGILNRQAILIDIDDMEQSELLMDIVEDYQLNCRVYQTTRGRHFLFKNKDEKVTKCYTGIKLAIGLDADIKVGLKPSYEVLKFNGEERFIEYDIEDNEEYQEVPAWLIPVKYDPNKYDFRNMGEGDGRNQALFSYELILQTSGLNKEDARTAIRIINKYMLMNPLGEDELDVIMRDGAFEKPIFYDGSKFKHNVFGDYLKSEYNIIRFNNQLHCYRNGIYMTGYRYIENLMIKIIPTIKSSQRSEVIKYLESTIVDNVDVPLQEKYIAFKNGVLNIETKELHEFSPEFIVTNRIPWDYNPNAKSEVLDEMLNNVSCGDTQIRALLEECAGYCLFRKNFLEACFLLTGSGSNGKSTYLDTLQFMLGESNVSNLDMYELGEKFSTSSLVGKLANIGDDISSDFLSGRNISLFKKIVSSNTVKGENKGQDIFFFKPYAKLLFSANEIPRMSSKGLQAIKRRLIIIPFNANFNEDSSKRRTNIKWDLQKQDSMEYFIQLALQGLDRIIDNNKFTKSEKVQDEMREWELDNNSLLLFLQDVDKDEIINEEVNTVYVRYSTFCNESNLTAISKRSFTKEINKELNLVSKQLRIDGRRVQVFREYQMSNQELLNEGE